MSWLICLCKVVLVQLEGFEPHLHIWPLEPSVPTWNWHSARTSEAPGRCEPATESVTVTDTVRRRRRTRSGRGGRGVFSMLKAIMARWEQEKAGLLTRRSRYPQFVEGASNWSAALLVSQKASRHHQATTAQPTSPDWLSCWDPPPPVSMYYVRWKNGNNSSWCLLIYALLSICTINNSVLLNA